MAGLDRSQGQHFPRRELAVLDLRMTGPASQLAPVWSACPDNLASRRVAADKLSKECRFIQPPVLSYLFGHPLVAACSIGLPVFGTASADLFQRKKTPDVRPRNQITAQTPSAHRTALVCRACQRTSAPIRNISTRQTFSRGCCGTWHLDAKPRAACRQRKPARSVTSRRGGDESRRRTSAPLS